MILHSTRVHGAFRHRAGDRRGRSRVVYRGVSAAGAGRAWLARRVRPQRDLAQPPARHAARPALPACAALGSQARDCIRGAVYDVIADVRPDRRRSEMGRLRADAGEPVCAVPSEGVAHGYQTLVGKEHRPLSSQRLLRAAGRRRHPLGRSDAGDPWPLPPSMLSEQDRALGTPHPMTMTRVLVTGASGFVGRWSLAPLAARGADVHAAQRGRRSAIPMVCVDARGRSARSRARSMP